MKTLPTVNIFEQLTQNCDNGFQERFSQAVYTEIWATHIPDLFDCKPRFIIIFGKLCDSL